MILAQIFVFLFGLIIGSFLNVVIYRYNTGFSLNGRSGCLSCGKKLSWYELIPVFSFLFQKAKCRGCKTQISWQYPFVETTTGVLFLLVFNFVVSSFSVLDYALLTKLAYLWVIFSLFIVITVYDIRHKIIPDMLAFLFAGLSLLGLIFGFGPDLNKLNLLAGVLLPLPFAFLWFVSKGRWIGLGDAKLMIGMGWFLGLFDGISAVILSFWIGSVFGVSLVLLSKFSSLFFKDKHFTIKSEIPFAPFLIVATIFIFFFGWDILGIKLLFN